MFSTFVKRLKIGEQEIEIPLSVLGSYDLMEIKKINVSFCVEICDLATRAIDSHSMIGTSLTYTDLEFMLDKIEEEEDNLFVSTFFR